MPAMPSAKEPTEFELASGQHNYDVTDSEQLLRSFFKSAGSSTPVQATAHLNGDDPDDLDALDESGGLGVTPKKADHDDTFSSLLGQRTGLSQDRLLEQLIGTKAAKAKKKELAGLARSSDKPGKASATKYVAQKESDGSEDERGRASAFKSRRQAGSDTAIDHAKGKRDQQAASNDGHNVKTFDPPPREARASSEPDSDTQIAAKPAKRKAAGGYLDELLANKAKKKKKKGSERSV